MKRKCKRSVKWHKVWEIVDEAKGGYAETAYECFDFVPDIPLFKSKVADIWYIGDLRKEKYLSYDRLFFNKQEAQKAFDGIKAFQKSELDSRYRFENMSIEELQKWIKEFGKNPYVGESVYLGTARYALEKVQNKKKEMEM